MRQIDWSKKLSPEDVQWVRASGMYDVERMLAENAEKFGTEVPESPADEATRSAMDAAARSGEPMPGGVVTKVDPSQSGDTEEPPVEDIEGDDYETWTKDDLSNEVDARNALAAKEQSVSEVTVEGTGKDGAVLKADLVKGLRLWDQENPDALSD